MGDVDSAAEDLNAIRRTDERVHQAAMFAGAVGILFIWGGVWTVGYLVTWAFCQFRFPDPTLWLNITWGGVLSAGWIGSWLANRRYPIRSTGDWRFGVLWGALFAYLPLWIAICRPANYGQLHAFMATAIMFAWIIIGLLLSNRFWIFLGALLTVLIAVGFFLFGKQPAFWLWMAVFGGGGMLVSGCYVLVKERRHG